MWNKKLKSNIDNLEYKCKILEEKVKNLETFKSLILDHLNLHIAYKYPEEGKFVLKTGPMPSYSDED